MSGKTTWIYGVNPVREALRSGGAVKAVHVYSGRHKGLAEIKAAAEENGVSIKMEKAEFFESRFPKGHQGVAAQIEQKGYVSLDELLRIPDKRGEAPFFVLLDEVEDPRNLGAVLRTAEAAGVHGVVIQKHRQAGLGPIAIKASAGASEHMALASVPNIKNAIYKMKDMGITVAGAEAGPESSPWDVDLSGPLAIVVGSEGRGLRRTVLEKCDIIISLPMHGRVNSLNASVAAGVLIYEVLRQRAR